MALSREQEEALDLDRSVWLSAGAGSGKTSVLIERYLRSLVAVGFDLDAVLAVTFTKKATAEVVHRVRDEVTRRIRTDEARAPEWRRVRERLPDAWILTIDAFCHRVLCSMGPAAGLAAERRILTGGALSELLDEAMRQVVDHIADAPADPDRDDLRRLLESLGRRKLVEHLRVLVERRARAGPWARELLGAGPEGPARLAAALDQLRSSPADDATAQKRRKRPAPAAGPSIPEQWGLQVGLARLFERLLARYRELLSEARASDFRQLLEDVAGQFRNDRIRRAWAARFRHVVVDEFQDTDPLQWEVLRGLFGDRGPDRPGLFVVGDEKQAIFSFRDGDVVTFRRAGREIGAARGAELGLADNYRSTPRLVDYFNRLSEVLFAGSREEFEARHAPMRAARRAETLDGLSSRIEVLIGRGDSNAAARTGELHAIATRIRAFESGDALVCGEAAGGREIRRARLGDQAILLRARTILPDLETVLTAHGIPFRVLGGVGFYEQHEVRALCNLMRFLADDKDDLALLGALRSPLFAVPDSALLAAVRAEAEHPRWPLWRKVEGLAARVRAGDASLPTPSDAPVLADAIERLVRYRRLADRLASNDLLALAIRESDLMLTLGVVDPSGRAAANVEKLLDLARRCRGEGIATLDELERTISLAQRDTDTPEAQADPPASAGDAVSILTVHAAKGLEWPIVFVPALDSGVIQTGGREPPARLRGDVGLEFLHGVRPDSDDEGGGAGLHEAISKVIRTERSAELKRLLYVAVTRARDHLVLSGAMQQRRQPADKKDSWLRWSLAACDPSIAVLDPAPRAVAGRHGSHPRLVGGGWPEGGEPGGRRLTPGRLVLPATAVAIARSCARRYFLERVVGVSGGAGFETAPGGGGPAGTDADVPGVVAGSIVHQALEGLSFGGDPVARVPASAASAGVTDPSGIVALQEHVRGALAALRAWSVGRRMLAAASGALRAEVPFELGRGAARLVGSIDLLFRDPETTESIVLDYKTQAPRSPGEARRIAEEHGYRDQIECYAAAAHEAFGGPVSGWLFFTGAGLPLPVVGAGTGLDGRACSMRVAEVLESLDVAASNGFPMTREAAACDGCPHRGLACAGLGGA